MIVRDVNRDCLCCGGQLPGDVDRSEGSGHVRYQCPECGDTILDGMIATGGYPVSAPIRPPPDEHNYTIGSDVDFHTWEVWWTGIQSLTRIHGVLVRGNPTFEEFVDEVKAIYDT